MTTIPTERQPTQLRALRRHEADAIDALAAIVADVRALEQRAAMLIRTLKTIRQQIRDREKAA